MGGIFGGNQTAATPPPPPPPPPANAPTYANAAVSGAQAAASMVGKGVGSTLLTGGQGLQSPALTTGKTLLGQ